MAAGLLKTLSNRFGSSKGVMRGGGALLAYGLRALVRTLDVRIACYEDTLDPAVHGFRGPAIFIVWHEYIIVPPTIRRGTDAAMLISEHRDALWMTYAIHMLGFKTVSGSSTRGGAKAVLQFRKQCRSHSLVITPDGPTGPRRQLSAGCIHVARMLGLPIVPIGCGLDRPWRVQRAWDKFAIPRPGSRARLVLGPAIHIPTKLSEAQVESYRAYSEQMLVQLTSEAEEWALDGDTRENERPAFPALHGSIEL